ncbi:MAG: MauE/DoxX family redox-associated membrane protein [Myxococcota bacterium]|jgi:uncharacterized membrane protein YphA (DoxX/SURF4 family)|nr:MauE/DoxX family redox-associated membrane protein [Myxococcota bacterium]
MTDKQVGGKGQAPNEQEVSEARHESASVAGASDVPVQRCEGLARASESQQLGGTGEAPNPARGLLRRFYECRVHSVLALMARWYLAYVFIEACIHKIKEPSLFAVDVATYQILPLSLINLTAITLPWMELGAGIMLVVGFRSRAASLMVSGMMVVFMIALGIALHNELDISCGCFASNTVTNEDPISWHTMARDGGWLALALYALFFDRRPLGIDGWLMYRKERSR